MNCTKCKRTVNETIHTTKTYIVDYYTICYPVLLDSGKKDTANRSIMYVKIEQISTCKDCYEYE